MSTSTTSNNQNQTTTTTITPSRFTKEEKQILYDLFHENEDIIDIKFRRNSAKKNCSVRECWDKIAAIYNNHSDISTMRNVKQIQKFWLNARLRKHYPTSGPEASTSNNINNKITTTIKKFKPIKKFETINVIENNIKYEKECESEEIEMIEENNAEIDDDMNEYDEQQDEHEDEIEISTSSNDVLIDNTQTTTTTHQYNIDHISADKLTLHDLLEFKNSRSSRPGDEIVLQIKTPGGSNDSLNHQNQKDNSSNSSIQAYTTTSYRISNPTTAALLSEQYQTTPIIHQQQPQIIQQQPALPQLHHKSTLITGQQQQQVCCSHNNNTTITSPRIDNNIEEKINFYRMKEAELKYKEEQLKLEQTKIELAQSKEILKHLKELHVYQIEEMKLKIKRLNAEEKNMLKESVKKI